MKDYRTLDRRGLTLTELMITLSIFGIIMAVVMGFVTGARNSYSDTRERARYQQTMRAVMAVLKERGLFFVDSVTAAESVAYQEARRAGLDAARNRIFLDADHDSAAEVRRNLAILVKTARARGFAIGIAHPYPETLEVLREEIPRLSAAGVSFVTVSELIALRDSLGLQDTVHFLGWVPNAAATMLPSLDIFIQSSLWEAMSMVVLEAMACEKPVVATDVGDNRHMVTHDQTGFVVQPGDVGAMVDALEILCVDPAVRAAMGKAGKERHALHFTVADMVDQYCKVYEDLLSC